MLHAIILAGGKGERFWPLSSNKKPKQLVRLFGERTMLEETMVRMHPLIPPERQWLIASPAMKEIIREHVPALDETMFLTEPEARNTAPAIALAAAHVLAEDPAAIMVVLPCDHLIRDAETLRLTISEAADICAETHRLCLIGIEPDRPETGYGYIEIGERLEREGSITAFEVHRFREKPDRKTAETYVHDQRHFWNSGMFIWRATDIIEAIRSALPETGRALEVYRGAIDTPVEQEARVTFFKAAEAVSIDKGVLEKAARVAVLKGRFLWDDVGSWGALDRVYPHDAQHNVLVGRTALNDCYDCTVLNEDEGPVVAFGVSDLVIVRANGVVLVTHKTRIPDMRDLMEWVKHHKGLGNYL